MKNPLRVHRRRVKVTHNGGHGESELPPHSCGDTNALKGPPSTRVSSRNAAHPASLQRHNFEALPDDTIATLHSLTVDSPCLRTSIAEEVRGILPPKETIEGQNSILQNRYRWRAKIHNIRQVGSVRGYVVSTPVQPREMRYEDANDVGLAVR